jgi:BirA family biotin operon repressor/biotin-[acetyl-CoA-carboxylase] ligase
MKQNLQIAEEELITFLQKNRQIQLSTKQISEELGIHPYVLYQLVKELRRWGFKISLEKGKGYQLLEVPDFLLPSEIKKHLKTKILGKEVLCYRTIGSTNNLAFRLAESGAQEGTLIVADEQTKGRGRMGRNWYSPPKLGLWMSLILRPDIPPSKAPSLSICAGLALAQAIGEITGLDAKTKWPNDCLLNGRKVGGVLLELSAELDRINFMIAGIGVNVNHQFGDFPKNLSAIATSLRIESGNDVPRVKLLSAFMEKFEAIYLDFKKNGLSPQRSLIKKFSFHLGTKVTVKYGREKIEGIAEDIDDNGSLIIRVGKEKKVVTTGEVTLADL